MTAEDYAEREVGKVIEVLHFSLIAMPQLLKQNCSSN